MKKYKYFILGVAVVIAFSVIGYQRKPNNENKCPYEDAECPNVQEYLQDYQIKLHMDTVWIYDYDRLVGKFVNTKWDSQLDSVILKDNL
jgi:hypothetical protein